MAELAGVVLGGIPIILWALQQYHDPVKSYRKYDMTLSTLRNNIFVQQQQLRATFSLIGLGQPSIDELRECLEEKYPYQREEFLAIIEHMDKIINDLLYKLEIDMNGKPLWADEPPNRVQWEWRRVKRSFGIENCKTLIEELQYWNTALKNCFEKPEVAAEDDDSKVQELQARFNHKRCDSIRDNVQAIHAALKDSWNCGCPCSHHASIDLERQSELSSRMSEFDIAFSFRDTTTQGLTPDTKWRKLRLAIERSDLGTVGPIALPVPAQQESRAPSPNPSTTSRRNKLSHFLTQLQNRKPKSVLVAPPFGNAVNAGTSSLRTETGKISCLCSEVRKTPKKSAALGYLPDPDQKKRKFRLSHSSKPQANIVKSMQLKSLLTGQQLAPVFQLPPHVTLSAKQRYGLAASVAWAILHFSCTPWLSDSWDTEQVEVFLESPASGREFLSQNHCISYLFETQTTTSISKMADPFTSNQIRNQTLFPLGILLIELCINKPFDEFRVHGPTGTAATSILDDFAIAESKLDEVYNQAGESYGYAVQRCLRCEFPGRDVTKNFDFSTFRRHFYNNVVAPVQATYLRYPASCAVT